MDVFLAMQMQFQEGQAQRCSHCKRAENKEFGSHSRRTIVVNEDNWETKKLAKKQQNDEDVKLFIAWKEEETRPEWKDVSKKSTILKGYWAIWDSLNAEGGMLKRLPLVDDHMRSWLMDTIIARDGGNVEKDKENRKTGKYKKLIKKTMYHTPQKKIMDMMKEMKQGQEEMKQGQDEMKQGQDAIKQCQDEIKSAEN
ncbi:hypothetical protein NQ317_010590 [Molorchus minor]|uniref:Uncharacterized protein n=1 Tax=Molorchus minor TaxID=1323400 RepID=A0ABQ9IQD3_9CUCU|nr:hypothetical protein NQ317_010590 [Molorchus minor]